RAGRWLAASSRAATPWLRPARSRPTSWCALATRPPSARPPTRSPRWPPRWRAASRRQPTAPSTSMRRASPTSSPARPRSRRRSSLALPAAVEEAVALEYALDSLEPLLFVLRGLVERAVARLGLAGIGCARVALALGLDDRGREARALPLAAPTRDVKAILGCLRAELEAHPPRAAIVHVALTAVPEAVRAMQMGLFVPPGPAPERLATTLARLSALCGPD